MEATHTSSDLGEDDGGGGHRNPMVQPWGHVMCTCPAGARNVAAGAASMVMARRCKTGWPWLGTRMANGDGEVASRTTTTEGASMAGSGAVNDGARLRLFWEKDDTRGRG